MTDLKFNDHSTLLRSCRAGQFLLGYRFIKNAGWDSAIGILSGEARRLTLSLLDKSFSIRLIEMFFLSSPYGDTLHKISKTCFPGKIRKHILLHTKQCRTLLIAVH